MKKIFRFLIVGCLIVALSAFHTVFAAESTNPGAGLGLISGISSSAPLYGRLSIPSANIDVALYNGSSQSIVDANDSAAFYCLYNNQGMTIADHASQAFQSLPQVCVGDTAVITLTNNGRIYLRCVDVLDGKNNGKSLTDNNGNLETGKHDYLTYTCLDKYEVNIRICQWDIVNAEGIDKAYDLKYNIDSRTKQRVATYAVTGFAPVSSFSTRSYISRTLSTVVSNIINLTSYLRSILS